MQRLLLPVVVTAVVLVVALFLGTSKAGPTTSSLAPKSLAELPLTQSFLLRTRIFQNAPFLVTMPVDAGLALTQLGKGGQTGEFFVKVNGVRVLQHGQFERVNLNPPVLVPPGGSLQIEVSVSNMSLDLGGYFLTRADLGLP